MVTGSHGVTGLLAVPVVLEEPGTGGGNVCDLNMVVKTVKVKIMKQKHVTPIIVQVSILYSIT